MNIRDIVIELMINMLPVLAVIYVIVGIKYLRNFRKIGISYFALMLFACAIYSFGYFLEVNASNAVIAEIVRRFEYIGVAFVPAMGVLFILQFTQVAKIKGIHLVLLSSFSLIILFLECTDSIYHFFYYSIEFLPAPYGMVAVTTKGPGYFMMLSYYAFFLIVALVTLYRAYHQARQKNRIRSLRFLLVAFHLPWLTVLFILLGFDKYVDPTPMTIVIMCGLFAYNEMKNDMFQLQVTRWRSFYDTIVEPAFLAEAQSEVLAVNHAAEQVRSILVLSDEELLSQLDQWNATKEIFSLGHGDEQRWYSVSRGIYDVKDMLANYVFTDVTQKRLENEQLIRAKEQAEEASLMKSRFLANMSHELRTPMHGIMGYLDLLRDSGLNSEQLDYATEAKEASKMLLYLISDILDFSKIEVGKLKIDNVHFRVDEVVDDALAILKPKARQKGIGLLVSIAPDVPEHLLGDPSRVRQILNNLLGNALKFTDKGEISVNVSSIGSDGKWVNLVFTIVDTGIGISEEVQNMLFSPFVQGDISTTRKYGGTGLGLAITKELVKLMHGEISVKSQPGKGSLFKFSLRLELAPAEEVADGSQLYNMHEQAQPCTPVNSRQLRILFAEDNASNRILTLAVFKNKPWKIDCASNGVEALQAYLKQDYDVILMDCQMPEMDGYECTREIRALEGGRHRVFIVAITANAMEGDREKCMEAGMDEYYSKPIDYNSLVAMLEKMAETNC